MHDLLEARCGACGFSLKGLDVLRAQRERACALCGGPLAMRSNLAVSRRLPAGTGLLIGAFCAASTPRPSSPATSPSRPALRA